MFPKVARSFQRSEESEVLKLTVTLTAVMAVIGATLATIFPELPLQLLSPERLIASKALVPVYCWALVPMAVGQVLVCWPASVTARCHGWPRLQWPTG